jgi:hypothetical protein
VLAFYRFPLSSAQRQHGAIRIAHMSTTPKIYAPVAGDQFTRQQVEIWHLRKKGISFEDISKRVKMDVGEVELTYNEIDGWVQLDSLVRAQQSSAQIDNEKVQTFKEAQLLNVLEAIAFGKVNNYCDWDNNGVFIKDSASLTELEHQCISEIHQDANGNVRVKMHSKLAALEALLKYHRILPDTKDGQRSTTPIKVTEIEARIVRSVYEKTDE